MSHLPDIQEVHFRVPVLLEVLVLLHPDQCLVFDGEGVIEKPSSSHVQVLEAKFEAVDELVKSGVVLGEDTLDLSVALYSHQDILGKGGVTSWTRCLC